MQVGLLNVDGYYNSLLSFIDKAVDEGFVSPAARHIIVSAQTAQELMSKLEVYNFFLFYFLLLPFSYPFCFRTRGTRATLLAGPERPTCRNRKGA